MKIRKLVSFIIGLALIGLISWKLYEIDRHAIPQYLATIPGEFMKPELANTIIFYLLFGIKVLAIFLISTGAKKAIVTGFIFLFVVLGEFYYTEWPVIDSIRQLINSLGFEAVAQSLGRTLYLYLGILAGLFVYWIVLLIVLAAKKAGGIGGKITLIVFGLIPLAFYYVRYLDTSFVYDQWETIGIVGSIGLPLIISIMLTISQAKPGGSKKRRQSQKSIWFPAIETLK